MAYGFPVGYQQYYPNTFNNYPINQNVGATQNSALIWVQGEAGAKSYLVAPNQTVILWDSEQNIIYIKSADASGMPAIKILDYTIRENSPQKTNKAKLQDDFATKEDVSKEIKRLEEMIRKIEKPNDSSEQAL